VRQAGAIRLKLMFLRVSNRPFMEWLSWHEKPEYKTTANFWRDDGRT
jgi:hypothetical protein